jgi:heme-degrading monooxygenase HmoA
MIAVIFELQAADGQRGGYLQLAAELKPLLAQIDGFISIERFQSLAEPQKLLSLSFWRDEAAVQQWRNLEAHRVAQGRGRSQLLADYRLRVAQVVRDYGLEQREQAPGDSRQLHG